MQILPLFASQAERGWGEFVQQTIGFYTIIHVPYQYSTRCDANNHPLFKIMPLFTSLFYALFNNPELKLGVIAVAPLGLLLLKPKFIFCILHSNFSLPQPNHIFSV